MQEKTLLRIALITGLIGVSLLFIISREMDGAVEISEEMINRASGSNADEYVLVKGVIAGIRKTNKTTILELENKQKITAFVISQNYLELKKGDKVEIRGEFNENNLIADEIRLV